MEQGASDEFSNLNVIATVATRRSPLLFMPENGQSLHRSILLDGLDYGWESGGYAKETTN
jgi:hypothetical protein